MMGTSVKLEFFSVPRGFLEILSESRVESVSSVCRVEFFFFFYIASYNATMLRCSSRCQLSLPIAHRDRQTLGFSSYMYVK
jgi:hypothetical protein